MSETETVERTETDLLEDVRDLPETGCETRLEFNCSRRVEWRAVWHCFATYLICEYHRQEWFDIMEERAKIYFMLRCCYCDEVFLADGSLPQLVRFERV